MDTEIVRARNSTYCRTSFHILFPLSNIIGIEYKNREMEENLVIFIQLRFDNNV